MSSPTAHLTLKGLPARTPAKANGAAAKAAKGPSLLFLAAESLANFESVRMYGQDLPRPEEEQES